MDIIRNIESIPEYDELKIKYDEEKSCDNGFSNKDFINKYIPQKRLYFFFEESETKLYSNLYKCTKLNLSIPVVHY